MRDLVAHAESQRRYYQRNKEKSNAYRVEYNRRRRREHREHLRRAKGTTCSSCGGEEIPERLHFHHRDPSTKLFDVSHVRSRSLAVLDAEIAKCDVLCGSCHGKRHSEMRKMDGLGND